VKLSDRQLDRYSRNILLKEVGIAGQIKLLNARVLVVGAGGLGSPAALYLAAAGVGTIGILDSDVVELNNLQRQIIHFSGDVGKGKVRSAREKMTALNPDVNVIALKERLKAANALRIIAEYDFVIDGTDNFPAKFLINDACYLLGKPFSHAGVLRFTGQTMTYARGAACLRCLIGTPPPPDLAPTCGEAGIIGVVAGILGTIQAAEALRTLLNVGKLLTNRLLVMDASTMEFNVIALQRNPDCPLCGRTPKITSLVGEGDQPCRSEQEVSAIKKPGTADFADYKTSSRKI
jgi:molybdopterin-synthase adenylyltransferase